MTTEIRQQPICEACFAVLATHRAGAFIRMCEPCCDKAVTCDHKSDIVERVVRDDYGFPFYAARCFACKAEWYDGLQ